MFEGVLFSVLPRNDGLKARPTQVMVQVRIDS